MKKQDFFDKGLPKWPAMVVVGKPVTREQAAEILIRTNGYLSSNDNEFSNEVQGIFYDVECKGVREYDAVDGLIAKKLGVDQKSSWREIWDYKELKNSELGILSLNYLNNSRICSSWIGGPHGWCNWDGMIGCKNYNIGKWPSIEDVYNEWSLIAKTFPFLDLVCQLANHEADCEDSVQNPGPVVNFHVKNGKVRMTEPKEYLAKPEFGEAEMTNLFAPGRERGCTVETVAKAVVLVRNKMKEAYSPMWEEIK